MNHAIAIDSLSTYLSEVKQFPLLSKEQEYELATRYHENDDLEAARALITANLRFVVKVALEYKSYGVGLKDLIQEGNIGLMTAVKKFDPTKGFRLVTYAAWWIKSNIQEYILKTKGAVKRGARALKKTLFYKDELPADVHTSTMTGQEQLIDKANDLSLDVPVGDDPSGSTHLDAVVSEQPGQDELVANAQGHSVIQKSLTQTISTLNDREQEIIQRRFLKDPGSSLSEIAKDFGISRERVRQLESRALKKLKSGLKALPSGDILPELIG